jgi:hypothetical protein
MHPFLHSLCSLAMAAAAKVRSAPFGEKNPIFEAPTIKKLYIKLCRDHANLIAMGSKYSNFDAEGKLAYLDTVAMIGDRWDDFLSLHGNHVEEAFTNQCHNFLKSMSLAEEDYMMMLKKAHGIMRAHAEKERDR